MQHLHVVLKWLVLVMFLKTCVTLVGACYKVPAQKPRGSTTSSVAALRRSPFLACSAVTWM